MDVFKFLLETSFPQWQRDWMHDTIDIHQGNSLQAMVQSIPELRAISQFCFAYFFIHVHIGCTIKNRNPEIV